MTANGATADPRLIELIAQAEAGEEGIEVTLFVGRSAISGRICASSEFLEDEGTAPEAPDSAYIHMIDVAITDLPSIEPIPFPRPMRVNPALVWAWTYGSQDIFKNRKSVLTEGR